MIGGDGRHPLALGALDLLACRPGSRCRWDLLGWHGACELWFLGGAALLDVLVDSASQVADPAGGGERVDVVADSFHEVAIVADHHQRAWPAVEQILERRQRV